MYFVIACRALSECVWRRRSAAGSLSATEKLFESSAFDVCPTTQCDLVLFGCWVVGGEWQTTFLCSSLTCQHIHSGVFLQIPVLLTYLSRYFAG